MKKISVHIPLYLSKKKKDQIKIFKKVCNNFLNLSKKTELFIHTNKKIKNKNKRIKFIIHKFGSDHPFKLTWYCRKLMEIQKNNYDIFIYSEEDILFTKNNLNYWNKYKDKCINKNYNLGFLRVEVNKKNKKLYSSDQIVKSKYFVNLNAKKYFIPDNPYCGFWIYDKKEFNKFIKTKWWKFNWSLRSKSGILHIREMASLGWHGVDINGQDMDRYLATVVPIKNNKPDKNSFIRHLTDNYANSPRGLFGTIKINEIISKNIQEFIPLNLFDKIIKRVKYIFYSIFRINLKNLFKNNNLHPDLIKK